MVVLASEAEEKESPSPLLTGVWEGRFFAFQEWAGRRCLGGVSSTRPAIRADAFRDCPIAVGPLHAYPLVTLTCGLVAQEDGRSNPWDAPSCLFPSGCLPVLRYALQLILHYGGVGNNPPLSAGLTPSALRNRFERGTSRSQDISAGVAGVAQTAVISARLPARPVPAGEPGERQNLASHAQRPLSGGEEPLAQFGCQRFLGLGEQIVDSLLRRQRHCVGR